MKLNRTQSYIVKEQTLNSIRNSVQHPQGEQNSKAYISVSSGNRQRVPAMMQSMLRSKNTLTKSNKNCQEEQSIKQSKIGKTLRSKFKETVSLLQDIGTCEICQGSIQKPKNKNLEVYMCECQHKFSFCQSCLHHYTIYKVKNFEKVPCPHEGCPEFLDINTNFFKGLPVDIQKNYKKIHQFYSNFKDPNIKLCPQENCQGIIKKTMENVMVCNECRKSFCGKCLFQIHMGECQNEQLRFFQDNLHYRQCKMCKFIIEKNQGCNHMTCRCGHQFCYVCGQDWTIAHYGDHDENGKLLPVPDPQNAAVNYENQDYLACLTCNCLDNCNCFQNCCWRSVAKIIKLPIKLVFFLFYILVMMLVFLFKDFWIIIAAIVIGIFAGAFAFSFEIISDLNGLLCALAIIFFPITMVVGIAVAFESFFWEIISLTCSRYCDLFCTGMRNIGEW